MALAGTSSIKLTQMSCIYEYVDIYIYIYSFDKSEDVNGRKDLFKECGDATGFENRVLYVYIHTYIYIYI